MSKIVKIAVTTIITLLVVVIATLIVVIYVNEPKETSGEEQSIDQMISNAYETSEVTTDIENGRFVQVQFQVITDDKKALEELEKRDFQISNVIIKELAVMDEDDFQTGLGDLEETLKNKLNEIMTEGTVTEVYTIKKILQ